MAASPMATATRSVFERLAIDSIPWEPYRDREGREQDGVQQKTVFMVGGGKGYTGLFRLQPGAELPVHVHRTFEHHAWVVEGGCVAGDHYLRAGSYEYVPAGAEHGIDRAGPEGCTLFCLMLRA
ncbi:MAG: cupin domain-containing protein [Actinomycetota bacterium]